MNLAAQTPMDTVTAIHEVFASARGKVAFQLPSPETQYGWQHASRFYNTEQILRDGPISVLPAAPDASIPGVKFKNAKGETETVTSHLQTFPVDALIVVKDGKIAFEHNMKGRVMSEPIPSRSGINGRFLWASLTTA